MVSSMEFVAAHLLLTLKLTLSYPPHCCEVSLSQSEFSCSAAQTNRSSMREAHGVVHFWGIL